MKKLLTYFTVVLMLLSMLSGCKMASNSGNSKTKTVASAQELKPFGRYKKTVTYTVGYDIGTIPKLPSGQTYENDAYTQYLKKTLNIQSKDKFEAQSGDPYNQKVSMAVATGDLPDIMGVDADTLRQLVASDSIADLTDVYKSSTSDFIKAKYNSYDGKALKAATFNGRLMALPSTQNANIPTMLWIRQDWLDKLGLKAPKTVNDLQKDLTAFVQKDPGNNGKGNTIGLALGASIAGFYGNIFAADDIFATYNSFPRQWIKQNGKVVYGSTTNETKQALSKLADWYKKGLIDPQMAERKSIESLIISGQAGAFFGPWWSADYVLNPAFKKNPKINWKPYIISKNGDGKITAYTQNPAAQFFVVKKGFKHPELLPKIASALNDKIVRQDKNYKPVVDFNRGGFGGKPVNIMINFNDATAQMYKTLKATVDGKKDPKSLSVADATSYYNIKNYLKNPKHPDANAWSGYLSRMVAGRLVAETPVKEVNPVYFDQTPTMKLKWANLVKLEDQTFLKIVTGQESVNNFDNFVSQWKKTGGDQITNEVAKAIKTK